MVINYKDKVCAYYGHCPPENTFYQKCIFANLNPKFTN